MVWREPKDHSTDCYFCITTIKGIRSKFKKSVKYPNIPSAIRPIPHSKQLTVPRTTWSLDSEEDRGEADVQTDPGDKENEDLDFLGGTTEPHKINQAELNDLVRDLNLSKGQAGFLVLRLKSWNLLEKDTKYDHRQRQHEFQHMFSLQDDLVYCNDVASLLDALGQHHNPGEWKSFIDSSKLYLKAVHLHNGNEKP
jgi:hypothetical protein